MINNNDDEEIIIDLELKEDDISVNLALDEISPGAANHQDLNGRSLPNQHPISAITDLNETLENIDNSITELNTNVTNLQETKQDTLIAGRNISINNNIISADALSCSWGNLFGNIDDQLDLKERLDSKLDKKYLLNYNLTKLGDYLYTLHYNPDQMDYQKAIDYLYEKYHSYDTAEEALSFVNGNNTGACSGVRKGNFIGRNYDWTYSEAVSFVVTKEASEGKYKSIGIAGGFDVLDRQTVESREYKEIYRILPYMLVDGINEKGLVVTLNVVPVGEPNMIPTTGTHPELTGDNISMLQLPSYLLDNFATAQEAVNWIENSAKIYGMYSETIQEEMHVLIADKDNTFIVEFINNEAIVHSDKHAMTNFYLTGVEFNENNYPIRTTLTPHAQGVERYEIIEDNYSNINSSSTMREVMRLLTYTKAYNADPLDKWWMTEFVSDYAGHGYPYPDLTVLNTPQDFVDCGLLDRILELYRDRTRDGVSTWQTIHSSVYDIEKRQFTLIVQEEDLETEKTFQLFPCINDGALELYVDDPEFEREPACIFTANSKETIKFNIGTVTTYIFEQEEASDEWVINHNLNKFPSITVVDSGNNTIGCATQYVNEDTCILQFNSAFTGKAYLN